MRRLVRCGVLLVLLASLSGCGGAIALAIWGIDALLDEDGGGADLPPQVTNFTAGPRDSRDEILVSFSIANDDDGALSAELAFREVSDGVQLGPARPGARTAIAVARRRGVRALVAAHVEGASRRTGAKAVSTPSVPPDRAAARSWNPPTSPATSTTPPAR